MAFNIPEKIDNRFYLDMFITENIALKFQNELPYKNCDCKHGHVNEGYCPKCTKPFLLNEIFSIPARYNTKFISKSFMDKVDELMNKKFLLLKGSDFYAKLISYYIGKKYVERNKMVYYVDTKKFQSYNDIIELNEETPKDFLAMRFAEVIIFDDIAGKVSDINYKIMLSKRMDENLPVIFINEPTVVSLKDTSGNLLADVFEYEVDSIGIKI
jgi:hypothetical protein